MLDCSRDPETSGSLSQRARDEVEDGCLAYFCWAPPRLPPPPGPPPGKRIWPHTSSKNAPTEGALVRGQLGNSWGTVWGQLGDSWGQFGDSWGTVRGQFRGQLGDS